MNQPRRIIGIVGEIASGKDTAVSYLQKKYGASTHKFSTPLRDILKRLYLEVNRENMQNISTALRATFDQELLARVITEDVKNDTTPLIVVNGIRRFSDIVFLKDLPEFRLVAITADIRVRYDRLKQRHENADDATKTFEQFQQDNQAETEREIARVAANAHYSIDNNGGLAELYQQIETMLASS